MRQLSKTLQGTLPGPPPSFLYGNISQFKQETSKLGLGMRVWHDWFNKYGDTFLFQAGPMPMVLTRDADFVKYILQNDPEHFQKPNGGLLQDILGHSLLMSEGEEWYRKRRLMRNAFKKGALENFIPIFHLGAQELANVWKDGAINKEKEIDLPPYMNHLTMDIIGRAGFGFEFGSQQQPGKSQSAQDWSDIFEIQDIQRNTPFYMLLGEDRFKKYVPLGRKYAEARARILETVHKVITQRQQLLKTQSSDQKIDLLQYLMESAGEGTENEEGVIEENTKQENNTSSKPDHKYTNEELTREIMLFFIAGHETTSNLLSWTLYHLARNPKIKDKILEELSSTGSPGIDDDTPPPWSVVNNLPYMTQVLKETLRLHPPGIGFARMTTREEKFKNFTLPPKAMILVIQWSIHRDGRHYPEINVEEFNPDNFSPEKIKTRHPLAWIPFSAGQRNCIGMQFSLVEARTVLSYILPRFDFTSLSEARTLEKGTLSASNIKMKVKQLN